MRSIYQNKDRSHWARYRSTKNTSYKERNKRRKGKTKRPESPNASALLTSTRLHRRTIRKHKFRLSNKHRKEKKNNSISALSLASS
ncbi:hypothetical protein BDZ91DRAFT_459839 [Kalaharituber pfeilii]|nr:hypothetical protein BDZ91DRAFT_459839 [Kalaharituber pfeilii]